MCLVLLSSLVPRPGLGGTSPAQVRRAHCWRRVGATVVSCKVPLRSVRPFPFGKAEDLRDLLGVARLKWALERLFFGFADAPHGLFEIGQDADKGGFF